MNAFPIPKHLIAGEHILPSEDCKIKAVTPMEETRRSNTKNTMYTVTTRAKAFSMYTINKGFSGNQSRHNFLNINQAFNVIVNHLQCKPIQSTKNTVKCSSWLCTFWLFWEFLHKNILLWNQVSRMCVFVLWFGLSRRRWLIVLSKVCLILKKVLSQLVTWSTFFPTLQKSIQWLPSLPICISMTVSSSGELTYPQKNFLHSP